LKTEAFCRYKLELYKDLVSNFFCFFPTIYLLCFYLKVSYGEKNQTVGLSLALLKIGNWTLCRKLLISVPRGLAFAYPPLSKLLQGAVHRAIQPLYDSYAALIPFSFHVFPPFIYHFKNSTSGFFHASPARWSLFYIPFPLNMCSLGVRAARVLSRDRQGGDSRWFI
jgi:hypothetical protein